MKKWINEQTKLVGISVAITVLVGVAFQGTWVNRSPANTEDLEFSITQISIDSSSRLESLRDVYLKATFAHGHSAEFLKQEPLSLLRGEMKSLDLRYVVNPKWLANDTLAITLEIVKNNAMSTVELRCSSISRNVNDYNRSYQCALPGESKPILVYSLGKASQRAVSIGQN